MKKKFWEFVCIIKNAQLANKQIVKHTKKKSFEMLLNILWDEGYILGYKNIYDSNIILIYLKYNNKFPAITNFKIISKSSSKIYYSTRQLWKLKESHGLIVLSTSKGLLSVDSCKKIGVGGEPILIIK